MRADRRVGGKVLAGIVVLLLLLFTIGALWTARSFQTTAQRTAAAEPPAESLITASVTRQQLTSTTPVSCTVGYVGSTELQPSMAPEPTAQYTQILVTEGERLDQGSQVAEINGQPLFVLIGGFDFYRDLKLKDAGPDARMLNDALIAMGRQPVRSEADADVIDMTTYAALGSWYEDFGYTPPQDKDPIPASRFIVLKDSAEVTSQPRGTGAVADGPIAQIAGGDRELTCTGPSGDLTPEAATGQELRLAALPDRAYTVTVGAPAQEQGTEAATDGAAASEAAGPAAQVPTLDGAGDAGAAPSGREATAEAGSEVANLSGTQPGELVLAHSEGDELVVPSSALWTRDGRTVVTVVDGDQQTEVPVTVIFSADGLNAVEPEEAAQLEEGDVVKVAAGSTGP